MQVTWYGHACFSVVAGGKTLLFDPFVSGNEKAAVAGITVASLRADCILLSHGHFDHVADAPALAAQTGAPVLCGFEVGEWLKREGVAPEQVVQMNHGGEIRLPFGRAKMTPAIHSSTMPDGAPGGNPGGWFVEAPEGSFYYSGDTALSVEMKLVGERLKPRFAVLCIGDRFTMGPADALAAAEMAGVKEVMGVHHGTWPPIEIDGEAAKALFAAAGRTLHLPEIGKGAFL